MPALDPIKVYDARWEIQEFSDDQVRRLFEATLLYAQRLNVDTLTLARDARLGGPRVLELALDVALRAGFRVFLTPNPISTPHSYFTTLYVSQEHRNTMGLTITASHNPKQYIGVKFTVPVVHAIGENCGPLNGLTKIREIYHSPEKLPAASTGFLHLLNLTDAYIDYSLRHAGAERSAAPDHSSRPLSVVLDTFHGSAGPELHLALTKAGVHVEPLRLIPNGDFPTGSPNPTSQGKMNNAVALAAQKNCDVVIGIDGDGDRIVFGSPRGILTAGFAFIPILQTCLLADDQSKIKNQKSKIPPVLYDPKVSPLALAEWGRLGALPVLFRNGHSQIKDYMKAIGALAAAEESGHYYHRLTLGDLTIAGENSLLTILLFLNALQRDPQLMTNLWQLQDQIFTTGEFNYQFDSDNTRDKALAAVVQHFVSEGAQTLTATPDGIDLQGTCLSQGVHLTPGSVHLDPGWFSGYLRIATNEKAVVRSYFSAGDTPSGQQVESAARHILQHTFHGHVID